MPYLLRVNVRPDESKMPTYELTQIQRLFDVYAGEVRIYGEPIGWDEIDEVELVKAPTVGGLSSWLLGKFVNLEDRFHVGVYMRRDEAVLANLTARQALYTLQAIAYYAPRPVRYRGLEGIVPLTAL
jgi:hypothetical protein